MGLLSKILRTGIVTEPLGTGDSEVVHLVREVDAEARRLFGRALGIREVDAGSCNGCEIEITGLMSPVYDSERFGFHFVASPRHADLLLVTGPVTRNMEVPLRKTYEATPDPKLVVAVGDCARTCGVFAGSYALAGSVDQIIPVNVFVSGCPPEPAAILRGVLAALYGFGYSAGYTGRYSLGLLGAMFNLLLLALSVQVMADNALTFLIAWEGMSLAAYWLVLTEHDQPGTVRAGVWYIAMTH